MRLILLLLITTMSAPSLAAGALDQIQQQYLSSSSGWMNQAIHYANELFSGLALIEFVWSGIQYLLRKHDLSDLIGALTLKILSLSFFYTLLTLAPQWIPLIISSFSQAGASISGTTTLSPSGVFNLGPQIANQIILALGSPSLGLQALGSYLFSAISAGLSALIIVIAYAFASLQLLITLIESYIVIGGGAIMLGFLGSRWTLPFGERYLGYAVSVGIKLFVLYLIVGLGPTLTQHIIQDLQMAATAAGTGSPPPGSFFTAAAISLVFGALCFMIPALSASFLNGQPSLSLGNIGASALFTSGTALGLGATGLSVGAKLANQTIGAAKAVGSGAQLLKDKGVYQGSRHGLNSMGAMVKDHILGTHLAQHQRIKDSLQDKQVQGFGQNTLGGELANRLRLSTSSSNQKSITPEKEMSPSVLEKLTHQSLKKPLPQDGSSGSVSIKLNHTE